MVSIYPLTIPVILALKAVNFAVMVIYARAKTPITSLLTHVYCAPMQCQVATPVIFRTSAKSATFPSIGS